MNKGTGFLQRHNLGVTIDGVQIDEQVYWSLIGRNYK
jgi:hypothetical protein